MSVQRPRELLILRHAKSAWDTGAERDFDRPLNARGKRDAPRVGQWLREQWLVPDAVLASPARRARQTVKRVCREVDFPLETVVWDESLYEATTGALLAALARVPASSHRLLLVGHNPGLEELLRHLCATLPVADDGKLLPTAALARLALPKRWDALAPGCAELVALVRVRDLP